MWFAVGCGPSAGDDGDTLGTTEAATGAETATPGDEGSDTGGPPADACAPIRSDEGEGQPVSITLRNAHAEPIFVGLGNECVLETFEVLAEDGTALDVVGPNCTQSCTEVIESGCHSLECGACAGPQLVRLEPGGTWQVEWSGVLWAGLAVPAACASPADCSGGCTARRLPEPGAHVVRAIAFATCTYDDAQPCEPCSAGDTACTLVAGFQSDFSDPDFIAEAVLDVPSTTAVELVFAAD